MRGDRTNYGRGNMTRLTLRLNAIEVAALERQRRIRKQAGISKNETLQDVIVALIHTMASYP